MTTLQPQLTNELSKTGTLYSNQDVVARSSVSNVIVVEVSPRPLPVKNSVSIEDLAKEFETDPSVAQSFSESRRRLADHLYADKPQTLTSLRLSLGMSQDQLAQKSFTSQSHVAKIESGKNDPSTDVVQKLANALGVDPAIVFTAIINQRKQSV